MTLEEVLHMHLSAMMFTHKGPPQGSVKDWVRAWLPYMEGFTAEEIDAAFYAYGQNHTFFPAAADIRRIALNARPPCQFVAEEPSGRPATKEQREEAFRALRERMMRDGRSDILRAVDPEEKPVEFTPWEEVAESRGDE